MAKHIHKEVKSDPTDRIEIELGDSKDDIVFQPQLKYMRWDNEVNFSLRLTGVPAGLATVEEVGETVIWRLPSLEIHWYGLPLSEENSEGGFEYEVVLNEEPPVNSITFSIESKGLDFFYQPPLNEEEQEAEAIVVTETQCIDKDGNVIGERPENVVGSYAVYHKTRADHVLGGKNYKTGKAFHLYRPRLVDANGDTIWADLYLDEQAGTLTVTINKQWLREAAYPVRHATGLTFGFESKGGTSKSLYSYAYVCEFTSGAAGTADSISWWITDPSGPGGGIKVALYDASYNLIEDGTDSFGTPIDAFKTVDLDTNPVIAATTAYNLAGRSEGAAKCWYDAGAAGQGDYDQIAYADFPIDPFGVTSAAARKFSVYCTYTPVGGEEYSLEIGAGSYTLTGAAALLPIGRVMGAAAGSYAVNGAAVGLLRDLLIGIDAGSYALSGNAVGFPVDRVIGAGAGSYAITGFDVDLLRALIMAAAGGTYTLTGAEVAFLYGKIMAAEGGSYAITGSDVDLLKAMVLAMGGGSYAITGQTVDLTLVSAIVARYALDAKKRSFALTAEPRSFALDAEQRDFDLMAEE